MNTLVSAGRSKNKTDIVGELQRESNGSFSVVYRALREVSHASGSGSSVDKSEVFKAIHRIQNASKTTKK